MKAAHREQNTTAYARKTNFSLLDFGVPFQSPVGIIPHQQPKLFW
jgi:hypothetical protein